ncbi:hypothetical protein BU24DRAFT_426633 [Aaosphaeria arxii CBS 175.79]|uniref:C2H2-type domain-containing protein n=1 Tax=Aaosphaeria arxii CBS 175.79 TaxID=1450172 RepID=A0A6A5XED3_9PLEO|nr:uncharacterized protein BU24DRAFT_426633 [Aaosphaeria arxii CBS 175.79]KAF2011555.1 hypothetical protein BU24DRAFT_426633 [Aaosphaeria arxii CBS 175.79]
MTMRPRKQPAASLYLTLKVIQAIKQLRRHARPTVSSFSSRMSGLGGTHCHRLEMDALRKIEKSLSRVSPQSTKQLRQSSNRVCKSRRGTRPTLRLETSGRDDPVDPNATSDKMQHVFNLLDGKVSPALTTATCSNDKLFLLKQNEASFEGCSMNETIQNLILVYNAIEVLNAVRSTHDDELLIAKGEDFGLDIDEKFIANYSHILLSLQAMLLETLARKVVETLIENDIDKRQRRLLNWLLSSAQHPLDSHLLSTTWPWSLKPSLAVLWGVCWMFYYPEQRNDKGASSDEASSSERVRRDRFLADEWLQSWNVPAQNDYLNWGLQNQALLRQSEVGLADESQAGGLGDDVSHDSHGPGRPGHASGETLVEDHFGLGAQYASTTTYPPHSLVSRPFQDQVQIQVQASDLLLDPASSSSIATNHPHHRNSDSQVQDTCIFAFTQPDQPFAVNVNVNQDDHDAYQAWSNQLTQPALPPLEQHSHSRHLNTSVSVPTVRVNHSAENQGFPAAPLNFAAYTNTPVYHRQHLQPQAQPPHIHTDFSYDPQVSFPAANDMGGHERNDSVNSISNMPTPISIAETRSPLLSPVGGPRRPSITSSHGHVTSRHPSVSEDGGDVDRDGDISPRRNSPFKRSEEPTKNAEGKMICKHPDCSTLIFDRKCEWSKHMDKHDRPYKCTAKGCEKLQGFTYSGGLLRHEREVHKMHGGTKKSLYCPFADCKRSTGAGFTRKENLAEHVRRVHRRTSMSSDLGNLIIRRSDTLRDDASESRLSPEMSYPRSLDGDDDYSLKRKRFSEAGISEAGDEPDLRSEVKRLRSLIEARDRTVADLREAIDALQQQARR